ncbi:MAG: hypothetical protein BJ554DRAFT_7400 [Olpidium bornovanus]|uniref:PUM-HD domain-containing protein n=1 Tax=Olpidium bornovanus TaxID=278681 RepID=A0A8H8DJW4_9FUNG|nr:MAG: hypothetical protein BJ554DRAFT_7400 [Olpidium bornovanus]
MLMIVHATPKDRKVLVKAVKPHVHNICLEEYGHMVLVQLLEVVDDTKLICKSILSVGAPS